MNDCVLIILLEEEHSYEMRLLEEPKDGKFSVSIRIPCNKTGDKLMTKLSPVFQWSTKVSDYQWEHGGKKKRRVPKGLQGQVTIRQRFHRWVLDGVVLSDLEYLRVNGKSRNVSEIRFSFTYETCTHLERPTKAG